MTRTGWNTKYLEILREFGYTRELDSESAYLLDLMIKDELVQKKLENIIKGKTVFIVGAGPALLRAIPFLKKYKKIPIIVADGASKALVEHKIIPQIVVTDLDGDRATLKKLGKKDTVMVVHAHGDNIAKLSLVEFFQQCLGTTQDKPFGKLHNFGGFTDGDRSVFLADHFGAKKVILFGMDFGTTIGKYSKDPVINKKIKIKKLKFAKKLLEWLALKSKMKMYTTTTPIKGFEKISYKELDDIIIT